MSKISVLILFAVGIFDGYLPIFTLNLSSAILSGGA